MFTFSDISHRSWWVRNYFAKRQRFYSKNYYSKLFATHSFTNSSSPNEIEKYLDFLDNWYENHQSELQAGELEKFKNKVEGVRKEWPFKVSHLVLLGMRRQSKPDKR